MKLKIWLITPVNSHASEDYAARVVAKVDQHWLPATFIIDLVKQHSVLLLERFSLALPGILWAHNTESHEEQNQYQHYGKDPLDEGCKHETILLPVIMSDVRI